MSEIVRKELDLGGKKLILETGFLAKQANGAVLATYGETVVLATAVTQVLSQDFGYFPLSVDYEEKLYAGGRISSSRFIKRENRPADTAILVSRLIDRSIRPLFPKDFTQEVQVIITVLSIDEENDPDVLSLIAASAALTISDIPWNGPIAGVRVGIKDSKLIINPTETEKKTPTLDVILASTKDEIVMIEAAGAQVEEKLMSEAFEFGVKEGKGIINLIEDFAKTVGKPKIEYNQEGADAQSQKTVKDYIEKNIMPEFEKNSQDETWFGRTLKVLEKELIKEGAEKITSKFIADSLEDIVADRLRHDILVNQKRPDGRKPDDLREITIKLGILPRTHGSAIFQRGDTQVLSIATLASPALEQLIDGMEGEFKKRYMHHYNFPPFSVGEVRRRMGPGRREIGHGILAEKSILPIIPEIDVFPYTIRIVSEVLSSAGSTSQAAVCGSTLALMDAGVPIKDPVAGISIGLITDKQDKSKYVTITDIAYQEDAQGDMDFKVAGTKNGITAIQMDIKLDGVSLKILQEAMEKAKKARLIILEKILSAMPKSRDKVSQHAPTVILIKIDPTKIGEVIGTGGRIINKIIAETGAAIDINDDGTVTVSSKDREACQKAAEWVEGIVREVQPGEEFDAIVKRILPFGAMVEYLPGKEGLVHISQLAPQRVETVEDVVKIGQDVKVRVAEIDDLGRVNLSMLFGDDIKPKGESRDRNPRESSRFNDRGRNRDRRGSKRY
jgi:polyribonucleotide nucleotidyltransferase